MTDEIFNAAFYRQRAKEARQSSASAPTAELRDGYMELAAAWDRQAALTEAEDMRTAQRAPQS